MNNAYGCEPDISIVVAVYNVMPFLEKCLSSIKDQSHPAFEAILIDDGSTDGSETLCDEYSRCDRRFITIHKKNNGLSSARNAGIKAAQGQFVLFVDGDDYLDASALAEAWNTFLATSSDIIAFPYRGISQEGATLFCDPFISPFADSVLDSKQALSQLHRPGCQFYVCSTGKLIRRELLSGEEFPLGKKHEDEFVTPYLFERASSIATMSKALYNYVQRNSSITHTEDLSSHLDYCEAIANRIIHFITSNPEFAFGDAIFFRKRMALLWHDYKKTPAFLDALKTLTGFLLDGIDAITAMSPGEAPLSYCRKIKALLRRQRLYFLYFDIKLFLREKLSTHR